MLHALARQVETVIKSCHNYLMHATRNVRRTSRDLTVVMEWLQGTARMFWIQTSYQKKHDSSNRIGR